MVFAVMVIKLLQVDGIIGGVAIIMNMTGDLLSVPVYCFVIAIVVTTMVYRGFYKFIENFSLGMIGLFALFTFVALYFINFTPYQITWANIWSGLQFHLPKEAVAIAFGAFGITGVGGGGVNYSLQLLVS